MIGYLRATHNKDGSYKGDFAVAKNMEGGVVHILGSDPLSLDQIIQNIRSYNTNFPEDPLNDDLATIKRTLNYLITIGRVRTTQVAPSIGGASIVKALDAIEQLLENRGIQIIVLPNKGLALCETGEKGDTYSIMNPATREPTQVLPRVSKTERLKKE